MTQAIYVLSGYNNYFNRQLKDPEETDVTAFDDYIVQTIEKVNFNPNDNITTQLVLNYTDIPDSEELDYLIVAEEGDVYTVGSRWFIIDRTRNLKNQWTLVLKRDILADCYRDVVNSPVYIEKGFISTYNPLIFNSEGFNYNQIKTGEEALYDKSGCGWLVGYVDAKWSTSVTVTTPIDSNTNYPPPPTGLGYSVLSAGAFYTIDENSCKYTVNGYKAGLGGHNLDFYFNHNVVTNINTDPGSITTSDVPFSHSLSVNEITNTCKEQVNQATLVTNVKNAIIAARSSTYLTPSQLDTLSNMIGNTYYDSGASKIFRVNLSGRSAGYINNQVTAGAITVDCKNLIVDNDLDEEGVDLLNLAITNGCFGYYGQVSNLNVSLTLINTAIQSMTISGSAPSLLDASYKMFAMPYGHVYIKEPNTNIHTATKGNSVKIASKLATQLGTNLYDLQLLPYCPFPELVEIISGEPYVILPNGTDATKYAIAADGNGNSTTWLLWCDKSTFQFNISKQITVPTDPIDFKIKHETEFIRLCAPNYSGTFEFKATANRGVNYFEVNCTYMPYQPYIHISPGFNIDGLYGGDYPDQRGLVLTGSFSIPIVTDHWIEYQINNASYADAFDRQVENMETVFKKNYDVQKITSAINIVTSGISGGVSGGLMGSSGGPVGATVGAVAGATLGAAGSAIGRKYDLQLAQDLHDESISYTKDMHNFNLQNIQALPNSISKVGAFNINNHIVPFLEYYDCTDQEKEMLRQYINYNGMAAGIIDTISNFNSQYINPIAEKFIQGKLVRFIGNLDSTQVMEINKELGRGVYI